MASKNSRFPAPSPRRSPDRREYGRLYYRLTRARRLELKARHYWCAWLLGELHRSESLTDSCIVPRAFPVRRPLLRLPRVLT